jgi:hypothetical protein
VPVTSSPPSSNTLAFLLPALLLQLDFAEILWSNSQPIEYLGVCGCAPEEDGISGVGDSGGRDFLEELPGNTSSPQCLAVGKAVGIGGMDGGDS